MIRITAAARMARYVVLCNLVGMCTGLLLKNVESTSKPTSHLTTIHSVVSSTGNQYCEDKPDIHCQLLNDTIGFCSEIHKAKVICRKYCNLCDLTDGQWCAWSSWSSCDMTCANGTQLRTRQCACPTAANSGLDCVGGSSDSKTCMNQPCPVHGGWSSWENWGSCSATCGTGMQRRDRRCTNPAPSLGGLQCLGEIHENRLCSVSACTVHGGWSLWENWGSCSATCGIGLQRRGRRCSNPAPSLGGLQCLGDSHEDRICFSSACADGHWSDWGTWSACSKPCDSGIHTKTRTCTNPRPSLTGRYCDGDAIAIGDCNTQTCPDKMVAFTAYGSQAGPSSYVIRFPTAITNYHNDYSTTTGKFTCRVAGLYHFAVTLTKKRDDIDVINAYIDVNGRNKVNLHADPADDGTIDTGSYSVSGAATFHLSVGDVVYIYGTASNFYNNLNTFFTGFLIQADN